jgi:hypothetical protein
MRLIFVRGLDCLWILTFQRFYEGCSRKTFLVAALKYTCCYEILYPQDNFIESLLKETFLKIPSSIIGPFYISRQPTFEGEKYFRRLSEGVFRVICGFSEGDLKSKSRH